MCEIHRISRDQLSISTSSCKYYGKLYQLIVDKMTEDSGSSEMKISVTLLSKEPRTAEILVEGRSTEWVVKRGSKIKYGFVTNEQDCMLYTWSGVE